MTAATGGEAGAAGVQSVRRAFELLELIADAGGAQGISQLSTSSGLPVPTIHRLLHTMIASGYVRQGASRRYALGPRLIRLGDLASQSLGAWAVPLLARLVEATGETANLAILEGGEVVYLAQAPSPHSMRMFTEPGHRVLAHCTAVGKALLAGLPPAEVVEVVTRTGMPALTPHTITDPDTLLSALDECRRQGYAVDDGEQELGVRCVAVAVPHPGTRTAISISGPQVRVDDAAIAAAVPVLREVAAQLARHFADGHAAP
ncbi:allantoin degradation transcriptional regulator AllR [Rugosimonospora acidiphila]|uniref:Allantoin degradation transcriptional regulator AllR n=1 Tax=Rugosimonospora acidiphila TaxID=556531 RepID=A0ABP9SJ73_9ACTN